MQEIKCKCGHTGVPIVKPVFFSNPNRKTPADPKFCFHVKALCDSCGGYLKHLPQDDDLMEYLNQHQPPAVPPPL